MAYRPKKQDAVIISEAKYDRMLSYGTHRLVKLKMTDYILAKFNLPMMPSRWLVAFRSNDYYYIYLPDTRILRVKAYGKEVIHNPWRENRNHRNWKAIREEQIKECMELGYVVGSVKHYRETEAYKTKRTIHK